MTSFRALGTDVAVVAPDAPPLVLAPLVDDLRRLFGAVEARYSRFAPASELARVNRALGPQVVSPEMFATLVRARSYTRATGGRFDPGIGASLIAAGYDRSFAPGALDRAAPLPPAPRHSILELAIDEPHRTVTRPPGLVIDLGGMVKGYAVDLAAQHAALASGLPVGFAIDAGGDSYVAGPGPDGRGWEVEVEDPRDPEQVIAIVRVRDRGIATSAANRRVWRVGDGVAHHLIDPTTGEPARSDLLQATVIAASTELADVLAKTAFLLGARGAREFLDDRPGLGAILVDRAGAAVVLGDVEVVEVRRG